MTSEQASREMLYVLDENFVQFYNISEFSSLIWTERYWECGDFELEVIYDLDILDHVKVGHYIVLGSSDNIMVIESLSISYEIENKANRYIVYRGRTMESIFDRRIVWGEWFYEETDMQDIIIDLLNQCIISPEDPNRQISFFRAIKNDEIPETLLTLVGDGDGLYEIIKSICQEKKLGMRCRLNLNEKTIEFFLYSGVNHSYDQLKNPPVIFSAEYGNIGPSRYALDTTKYKTAALAVSPWHDTQIRDDDGNVIDVETTRTVLEVGDFSVKGLNRRELFVSCGSGYPDDMVQETMEEIADVNRLEELDSELDPKRQFVYGIDYNIGDVVQVVTEFGLDAKAIVIEFIRSWTADGYTEVPTFKILQNDAFGLTPDEEEEIKYIDIPKNAGDLVYTGAVWNPILEDIDYDCVDISGDVYGVNAGEYTLVASLKKENYRWADSTQNDKMIKWKINKAVCNIPRLAVPLAYNEKVQYPTWSGYNPLIFAISGDKYGIKRGTYRTGFTPTDNYEWSNGGNETRYVEWEIGKARGSITLSQNYVELTNDKTSVTIPLTYVGGAPDGSILSTNPNIASGLLMADVKPPNKVEYSLQIFATSFGECEIRLKTTETNEYLESYYATVHVKSTVGLKKKGSITLTNDFVELSDDIRHAMVYFTFVGGKPNGNEIISTNPSVAIGNLMEKHVDDPMSGSSGVSYLISIDGYGAGECEIRFKTTETNDYLPSDEAIIHVKSSIGILPELPDDGWYEQGTNFATNCRLRYIASSGDTLAAIANIDNNATDIPRYTLDGFAWRTTIGGKFHYDGFVYGTSGFAGLVSEENLVISPSSNTNWGLHAPLPAPNGPNNWTHIISDTDWTGFYILLSNGSRSVAYSLNRSDWSMVEMDDYIPLMNFNAVCFAQGGFLAVGSLYSDDSKKDYYVFGLISEVGNGWIDGRLNISANWTSLLFAFNHYILVGSDGTLEILDSIFNHKDTIRFNMDGVNRYLDKAVYFNGKVVIPVNGPNSNSIIIGDAIDSWREVKNPVNGKSWIGEHIGNRFIFYPTDDSSYAITREDD